MSNDISGVTKSWQKGLFASFFSKFSVKRTHQPWWGKTEFKLCHTFIYCQWRGPNLLCSQDRPILNQKILGLDQSVVGLWQRGGPWQCGAVNHASLPAKSVSNRNFNDGLNQCSVIILWQQWSWLLSTLVSHHQDNGLQSQEQHSALPTTYIAEHRYLSY